MKDGRAVDELNLQATPSGMLKAGYLGVRVTVELKQALVSAAHEDRTPLASLVERALREWIAGRGGRPTEPGHPVQRATGG